MISTQLAAKCQNIFKLSWVIVSIRILIRWFILAVFRWDHSSVVTEQDIVIIVYNCKLELDSTMSQSRIEFWNWIFDF